MKFVQDDTRQEHDKHPNEIKWAAENEWDLFLNRGLFQQLSSVELEDLHVSSNGVPCFGKGDARAEHTPISGDHW